MQSHPQKFMQYWIQFSDRLNLNETRATSLASLLYFAYSSNHYHTHQHIVECLELFHQIKDQLQDPIAVELAIWFHDIIYDPKASDNEEKSAKIMMKHCIGILKKPRLEKVFQWIVSTKKHQATTDQDLRYLLDIDLAILGSSEQRFEEYEQQIRFEYAWVESEIYQMKRQAVLQYFADMEPLYQTLYFQEHFEKQAKINLKKVMV